MNILFVTQYYLPSIGGVQKHIREVTDQFLADGHRVDIIVTESCGNAPYENEGARSIYRLRKWRGRTGILLQMSSLFHLFRQAHIIHFHDFSTFWKYGLWLLPVLKLLRKKVYLTFHGWEGRCPPAKSIVIKRKICALLADGNICIGHFIEKWYRMRADIVSYGGVKRARELTGEKKDAVFVGRLSGDTGITEYVNAWKEINVQFPGLRLIICGDGPLRKTLEELVARKKIMYIEFKGFVKEPETYVKNAAVVFTSGYLGMLEAFSQKKPVIASCDSELKRDYLEMMPGSRDIMWIARDSGEIAACVKEALQDNEKTERAYRFSLENTWERVKRDYYSLWKTDARDFKMKPENNAVDHSL